MFKVGKFVRVRGTQSPTNPNRMARARILSVSEFKGRTVYDILVRFRDPVRMSFVPESDLVAD